MNPVLPAIAPYTALGVNARRWRVALPEVVWPPQGTPAYWNTGRFPDFGLFGSNRHMLRLGWSLADGAITELYERVRTLPALRTDDTAYIPLVAQQAWRGWGAADREKLGKWTDPLTPERIALFEAGPDAVAEGVRAWEMRYAMHLLERGGA